MGALRYVRNWQKLLTTYDNVRLLFAEFNKMLYLRSYIEHQRPEDRIRAMHHAAKWLTHSIHIGEDKGSGTYYFNDGWTSSYPETTGYIIPSLLRYAALPSPEVPWAQETRAAALEAGEWLLSIQHEDGGWPGGYLHQQRDSVVFNSGQILRGTRALYEATQDERYKDATLRCIEWILEQLDDKGRFSSNDYMGEIRVYGTYVMAPVLDWLPHFPQFESTWKKAAASHASWVLEQQNSLGWFANCDNTTHKNNRPIIHTIAYTIDGLWHMGLHLEDNTIQESALLPARVLATEFLNRGILNGRYDARWNGTESFIPTGGAQLAIVWEHMYTTTGEALWKAAFEKMNTLLVAIADRGAREHTDSFGALTGSFPFWGRYEPFALPNWATKYFLDSLLNAHERHS